MLRGMLGGLLIDYPLAACYSSGNPNAEAMKHSRPLSLSATVSGGKINQRIEGYLLGELAFVPPENRLCSVGF